MVHPLHVAVAEELQHRLAGRGELIKDPACGGTQYLPLFVGDIKRRDTRMCDVDLLIVLGGRVMVIVEIEESGFLPTKICGKFLQSAIATHFIHDSRPESALPYGKCVLFVQVLDGSKCLKPGTQKDKQGRLIEEKIRSILPLKGSSITDYRMFFVQGVDDLAGLESVGAAVSYALA
jgi:hypothetical protein